MGERAGATRRAIAGALLTGALAVGTPAHAAGTTVPVADNSFVVPGASFAAWAPALINRIDVWATDGKLVPQIDAHYYDCGGCTVDIVRYPRTAGPLYGPHAPSADQSIAIGAGMVIDDLTNAGGPSVVPALSLGALVSDAAQRTLEADPHRPPPSQVTFIVAGDPSRVTPLSTAIGGFLPVGLRVPVLRWTVTRPPSDSSYDTVAVIGEYDLVADFPDRPWNVLADVNAVFGFLYNHGTSSLTNPVDVPPDYIRTTTNTAGATTTTYLVPSPMLPMLRPVDLFLPDKLVAVANKILKPVVDRGYSRYDGVTGNRMPHLQATDGFPKLVRSSVSPGAAKRAPVSSAASRTPADTPRRRSA